MTKNKKLGQILCQNLFAMLPSKSLQIPYSSSAELADQKKCNFRECHRVCIVLDKENIKPAFFYWEFLVLFSCYISKFYPFFRKIFPSIN